MMISLLQVAPSLGFFVVQLGSMWDPESGCDGAANIKEIKREIGLMGVPLTDAEVTAILEV